MFWPAVIIAAIACACFTVRGIWPERPHKFDLIAIGLVLLTVAWVIQVVWATSTWRLTAH